MQADLPAWEQGESALKPLNILFIWEDERLLGKD